MKNNKASQLFLDVIRTWTIGADESTLCAEVTTWTATQDRGGLHHCSPRFYHFMKIVELNVQLYLNVKTISNFAGKNIIPLVVNKLKASKDIQEHFRTLIGYQMLSEELCVALLTEVLVAWVAAKARQITKNYIFDSKKQTKGNAARMGTP